MDQNLRLKAIFEIDTPEKYETLAEAFTRVLETELDELETIEVGLLGHSRAGKTSFALKIAEKILSGDNTIRTQAQETTICMPEPRSLIAWTNFYSRNKSLQIRRADYGLLSLGDVFDEMPGLSGRAVDFREYPKYRWPDYDDKKLNHLFSMVRNQPFSPRSIRLELRTDELNFDTLAMNEFIETTSHMLIG